jgi:serine protease inhibitor
MMHETDSMGYYQGKGFSAVTKGVVNANGLRFILPDEGVTIDEVLASEAFENYLLDPSGEDYSRRVALSVPKFDVQADSDVIPTLEKLGVEKVFDHGAADFTPLTEDRDDIAVDQILHSARVKIDEEGCEAAAFTAIMACGASMYLDEPIDFTLDRPFIFVINGAGGAPLFVGVVNQP